jgi:hypothetical protein
MLLPEAGQTAKASYMLGLFDTCDRIGLVPKFGS